MRTVLTNNIQKCSYCTKQIARLRSQRTGNLYSVELPQGFMTSSDTHAWVGVADFHNCERRYTPTPQAAPALPAKGEFTATAEFFNRVLDHGKAKRLSITLHADPVTAIEIKYNERKRLLYVTDGGAWGESEYYGAIELGTGAFRNGRSRMDPERSDMLVAFNLDPVATAVRSAKITGACSFCSRKLTDERSVAVGYGAICAEKYGLPWGESSKAVA
jgi:hypothetical protein